MIGEPLAGALRRAAQAEVLVVASDYDGTLAPIVADPAAAGPHRPALDALVALGGRPGVHAVIVSGRSREALVRLTGAPGGVVLIGSHGAEAPGREVTAPPGLVAELEAVAGRFAGTLVEAKPSGAALHYRHAAAPEEAAAAARDVGARHGVRVIDGKQVVELTAADADKGTALAALRDEVGAGATVFFGDDVTDEDAFAVLEGPDVAVKVGDGPTVAPHRVGDHAGVAAALDLLLAARPG